MAAIDNLPQEVLSVLPADPQAQLDLAQKIVAFAFAQKVAHLETESHQLREALQNKNGAIKSLERRVASMEVDLQEMAAKHKAAVEEQHKLGAERAALIDTVKRLNREVTRLDSFKRNLLQHLTEDEEPGSLEPSLAATDLSSERLVSEVLSSASAQRPTAAAAGHTIASYSTRGAMPSSSTPAYPSTSGRPSGGYGSSPPRSSFTAAAPTASISFAGSPRVDGKEFFKQARIRLSYEGFSQFLQNIKDLNAGRQSREETLRRGREIFGAVNSDLYVSFEGLLSRHLETF